MADWTSRWPKKPGIYLFFGYQISKGVEAFPRLHLVTVEYVSDIFGVVYRTGRYTIKKSSGAYGMWMPVMVPSLPNINENEAGQAARDTKPLGKGD